jgi:S1-C subfamily serine protease
MPDALAGLGLPPPPADAGGRPAGPHRGRRRIGPALLALALTASVVQGAVLMTMVRDRGDASTSAAATGPVATDARPTGDGSSLAGIIAEAMRSVVAVEVRATRTGPFGNAVQVRGQGSGVILDTGLVVTNAHVVDGAAAVTVVFGDGERADADVLGTDAGRDLAVLAVDTRDRPPIALGSSSGLELGQTVVALGYPLGLGATATAGIVSGLDRSIDVSDGSGGVERLEGLLQTDAAINPGNSGGPLIDADGRLVGINTASASAASAENIGFAIAIDEAMPVVRGLVRDAA